MKILKNKNKKILNKTFISILLTSIFLTPIIALTSVSCSNNQQPSTNHPSPNPPTPPIQNNDLDQKGGQIDDLVVDKYLSTIKLLNLNRKTILSDLNDNSLTNTLRNNGSYKNMNIKILDGSSEKEGILKLQLTGKYGDKNYNEIITISGFNVKVNTFNVSNLKINLENYFNNALPISTNTALPIPNDLNILKSIIESANFNLDQNTYSFLEMCNQFDLSKIDLKVVNNQLQFSFLFNTKFKKYSNGIWILDNQQENLKQSSIYLMPIYALKDLMQFMIDHFTLKDTTKDFYASYFKGLFHYSVNIKADFTTLLDHIEYESIINKYKPTYFPNLQISPQINISSDHLMQANDFNHSLQFDVVLIDFDTNENDYSIQRTFSSTNFKSISSFLELQKNVINRISIIDSSDSTMAKFLRNQYNNEIINCFNDQKPQTISLSANNLLKYLNNVWAKVFNVDNVNNQIINNIKKSYNLSLFNKPLINFDHLAGKNDDISLDLDTGLFKDNNDNQFQIENIDFTFDESILQPTLNMTQNTNIVTISFNAIINYQISGQNFTQQTRFSLTITKNSMIDKLLDAEQVSIQAQTNNLNLKFSIDEKNVDEQTVLKKLKKILNINLLYDISLTNFSYDLLNQIITTDLNIFIKDNPTQKRILKSIKINVTQENKIDNFITGWNNFWNDSILEFDQESDYLNCNNDFLEALISSYLDYNVDLPETHWYDPDLKWEIIDYKDFPETSDNAYRGKFICNIKVSYKNDSNIYKTFESEINYVAFFDPSDVDVPVEEIIKDIKIVPTNNPQYQNLTAKQFYKLQGNTNEIRKYFTLNLDELKAKFGNDVINAAAINFYIKGDFNFKEPRVVNFEISVQDKKNNITRKKLQSFNDFKEDNTIIGELDAKPINILTTPNGATSYKGELEKFDFDDISSTSVNQYKDDLNNYTWDKVKLEFMYQVRFFLYQTFSDNYSEINYYIQDEVEARSFTAVAEGIIKESKKDVYYGFLPHIGTPGWNNRSDINIGDRIKIEIKFDVSRNTANSFKPTYIERGEIFGDFTYSWWWNFKDNCVDLRNTTDPMYKEDLPRIDWDQGTKSVSLSINNSRKLGQDNFGQWNFYSFVDHRKIPK